ncbi:MAG: anti-sigma factor [Verrucomicrobia bacterium]|nr:anti-sigma factor [Verrucomicrobiota bacterium]
MSRPEFDEATQERASLHALGLLTPEEAAEFEREIWTRPGLRELVAEMRAGLEQVAREEATQQPPPRLRETLLDQLATRAPSKSPIPFGTVSREPIAMPTRRALPAWIPWALAASLAVAAGVSYAQLGKARAEAEAAVAKAKALSLDLAAAQASALAAAKRVSELEAEGGRIKAENTRLAAETAKALDRMRAVALTRTPQANPTSTAAALVVWDKQQKTGMLLIKNLPPAPAGKDYQLWAIEKGRPAPVSAGTFVMQPDGTAQISFKPSDPTMRCDQFAVSLEPAGGGPAPVGPVFLVGG